MSFQNEINNSPHFYIQISWVTKYLLKENPFLTEMGKGIVFKVLETLTYRKHITHMPLKGLEGAFKCAVIKSR